MSGKIGSSSGRCSLNSPNSFSRLITIQRELVSSFRVHLRKTRTPVDSVSHRQGCQSDGCTTAAAKTILIGWQPLGLRSTALNANTERND
ncbi:hypothetical protein KIN20_006271 [Parelaphostrongylus tenuis]|uniref:Uncharacterized protein n=1 Tax=Parelaphostrongylus tenuis TaxID=148309 RepID=A0AAD5M1I6_PARTN|nr:hypothetical protein KIN20_006271 [Parelaphostrongylus tenuis]